MERNRQREIDRGEETERRDGGEETERKRRRGETCERWMERARGKQKEWNK
jgi:hypothetical protein